MNSVWICSRCRGVAEHGITFGFKPFEHFPQFPDCPFCFAKNAMRHLKKEPTIIRRNCPVNLDGPKIYPKKGIKRPESKYAKCKITIKGGTKNGS